MSNESELQAAEELLASLKQDILLCKTREEHVRMTARANAASALVESLRKRATGESR